MISALRFPTSLSTSTGFLLLALSGCPNTPTVDATSAADKPDIRSSTSTDDDEASLVCGDGTVLVFGSCVDVDGCADKPCFDDVACVDVVAPGTGFVCGNCPDGMEGDGVDCVESAPSIESIEIGGERYACALYSDGSVRCWGANVGYPYDTWQGQTVPPAENFKTISLGTNTACGITVDDDVRCWGSDYNGVVSNAPSGKHKAVDVGTIQACAVAEDGTVTCWGHTGVDYGITSPPLGIFEKVAVGFRSACGIRANGEVECWGEHYLEGLNQPGWIYESVSAGDYATCGLRSDGTAVCWGAGFSTEESHTKIAFGVFKAVDVNSHACGVREDNTVECWGDTSSEHLDPPSGDFRDVAVGVNYACGIQLDGKGECWTSETQSDMEFIFPDETFSLFDVSDSRGCGVRNNGTIRCMNTWAPYGVAVVEQPDFAPGSVVDVGVGRYHSCALSDVGQIDCWGADDDGVLDAPDGYHTKLAVGMEHACAVAVDGTVTCWGDDADGKATPPTGAFKDIAAHETNTCGIHDDDSVSCWGYEYYWVNEDAPDGAFASVTVGKRFACALTIEENRLVCWGSRLFDDEDFGEEALKQISAGSFHLCAIRQDNSVVCHGGIGGDPFRAVDPPSGEYRSVVAGDAHTCATGFDDTVVCWGSIGRGLNQMDFD